MQTIDLTIPFAIPNATKLEIGRPDFDDDTGACLFRLTLKTNNVSSARICAWDMILRDGTSHRVQRQASPAVGLNIEDTQRYVIIDTRSTPTGYTDAVNAWRSSGTANNRQAAFKAHLLSAGHIDASLTGT